MEELFNSKFYNKSLIGRKDKLRKTYDELVKRIELNQKSYDWEEVSKLSSRIKTLEEKIIMLDEIIDDFDGEFYKE